MKYVFPIYRSKLFWWPVDFMYVNEGTFDQLNTDSEEVEIGVAKTRIVSAEHLLVLKIHAMRDRPAHRFSKDHFDATELLRKGIAEVDQKQLLELCERYADRALYDKLKMSLDQSLGS